MKTLDEVIKACEETVSDVDRGVDIEGCFLGATETRDALQWLKGYKAHIELDRLRNKCEAKNDPHTWDELRTMEGKPVWIEDSFDNGEWYIIECFTASNRFVAHDRWGDTTLFNKKEMGDVWKAYRREHHEN